jgi:hypothetical protein
MLICLACRRHDGDHALNCGYIAGPDHDSLARTFMDDNAELFESERLTHLIGGGPKRAPSQTTDEFLLAILAEPTHLERYEHSMAVADHDDAFEMRMRTLMAELNRLNAQSLKATHALMSWPEAES